MPELNPQFRKFFMDGMKRIALENGQSPESIEKDGPWGFELLTSLEAFELMCEAEDEFGVDLSGAAGAKTLDEIEEHLSNEQ